MERTLILIKPDAVERGLEDDIIKRYKDAGLDIVARKEVDVSEELAGKHYPATESQIVGMGKKTLKAAEEAGNMNVVVASYGTKDPREIGMGIRNRLIDFITSGPVIAMVLEGENAIKKAREVTGYTDPSEAEKGTIRGDFGEDSILQSTKEKRATENLVHASGNVEEAEHEISLWFGEEELE